MTVSPKNRMVLLAGALVLTLVAGFSADGGGQPDQSAKKGEKASGAASRLATPRERSDEVPDIAVTRKPPVEDMNDVFRSTSWYVPPPPPEPAPPAPPPLPFTYIGMMRESAGKVVFLSNQDNNYAIRKGDVVDGTYKVEEISEAEAHEAVWLR